MKLLIFSLVFFLVSCSSIRQMPLSVQNIDQNMALLRSEMQYNNILLDSLNREQQRLRGQLNADINYMLNTQKHEMEKLQARLEELQFQLNQINRNQSATVRTAPVVQPPPPVPVSVPSPSADTLQGEALRRAVDSAAQTRAKVEAEMQKLYADARMSYHAQDFRVAFTGFKQVYETVRTGDLAENALYWMGLCYEQVKQLDAAKKVFEQVLFEFPTGSKVCSSRYKLALLAKEAKENDTYRRYLQEILDAKQCLGSNEYIRATEGLRTP
jgi:TolA-binding protein